LLVGRVDYNVAQNGCQSRVPVAVGKTISCATVVEAVTYVSGPIAARTSPKMLRRSAKCPVFDRRARGCGRDPAPIQPAVHMKQIDAAIAIVMRGTKVLICQRKDDDTFGGYWEFPGGKQECGESLEQCLARELREELNITATPTAALPPVEHRYPQACVRLHPFVCEHQAGEPELIECQQALWIDPPRLRDYRFPPANVQLIEDVITRLALAAPDEITPPLG